MLWRRQIEQNFRKQSCTTGIHLVDRLRHYKNLLKMLVACLLTFLAALTAAVPTTPVPPNGIPQCARSECPVYTHLEDLGPDMWKRRIEPGLWARKAAPTCNRTAAVGLVYMDLHYYFADNNISRTTPIMMEITENKVRPTFCTDQSESFPCCEEIYGILFYIPAASQATAPLPTKESGVELLHMGEPREFYGITFSGRAIEKNVTEKYEQLAVFLDERDISFEDDAYIVASYDAPWRPEPHRNEVLIPVKKCRKNDGLRDQNDQDGQGGRAGGRDGDRDGNRGRRQRRNVGDLSNIDMIPL